jgi:GAF domain-containing protein
MSPDELLRQLGELASSLGPALRPAGADELLRSLTETARRLFGAAACSLALLTEDESELVYTVAAGQGADDVTGMRIPASRGIAGWVVQSGQPIAISDVAADPRFSREQAEQTGYIPQAILAVPVQTPARLLGVISLLDRDPRRPGAEQDMALLSLFADQAALALASVERFSLMGRVLLDALARAAQGDVPAGDTPAGATPAGDVPAGDDLAGALRQAADHLPAADADLAELAATFAVLARRGAAERRLALAVLRDIADYTERRPSRR